MSSKEPVCVHCGQRAVYPRLGPTKEERSPTLVCWECGKPSDRCRCKGNVKLAKFGIEVEAPVEEPPEPAPRETVAEDPRSDAALATKPRRRTSPHPPHRAKKGEFERPRLEAFE